MAPHKFNKVQKQEMAEKHGLTMNNIETILTWNNQIFDGTKSMDNLNWVDIHDDVISEFYQDQVKRKKLQPSTLRKVYSTLAAYYKKTGKDEEKRKAYATLNKTMSEAEHKVQVKQELKPGEKFVPYDTLVQLRDEMLRKWRAEPANRQLNIKALILSLNTYFPPLRGEMRSMKLYDEKPKLRDVDYMYRCGQPPRWCVFIGEVIKGQKKVNYSVQLGPILSSVIDESLKHFKRQYILSGWNYPQGDRTISDDMFSKVLGGFGTNISGLRKAYITEFYENRAFRESLSGTKDTASGINRVQKEYLANLMRHNVDTQEKYYVKTRNAPQQLDANVRRIQREVIDLTEQEEKAEAKREEVKEEKEQSPVPRRKTGPKPRYDTVQEYQKQYKLKHEAKGRQYAQRYYADNATMHKARVYVGKLNLPEGAKYRIKCPRDRVIEEYKLRKVADKWVSDLL